MVFSAFRLNGVGGALYTYVRAWKGGLTERELDPAGQVFDGVGTVRRREVCLGRDSLPASVCWMCLALVARGPGVCSSYSLRTVTSDRLELRAAHVAASDVSPSRLPCCRPEHTFDGVAIPTIACLRTGPKGFSGAPALFVSVDRACVPVSSVVFQWSSPVFHSYGEGACRTGACNRIQLARSPPAPFT